MRFLPLLGVGVALVAGVSAASGVLQRPVPVTVAFWDAQHGVAALTSFAVCGARSVGEQIVLERTADGGRSWKRFPAVCAEGTGFGGEVTLATAGTHAAYLAVPGGLLETRDRGASWTTVRAPRIVALSFRSPSVGWAVAKTKRLVLRQTRDAGRTWTRLPGVCNGEIAKIAFAGRGHGWLLCLGEAGVGNQGKAVYETHDGGSTWQLRARAPFLVKGVGRLDMYGYPIDVVFRPDGRGWMPQLRGATLTTRDGGRTWSRLSITAPEARLGLAVSFVSDTTGFVLVQNGVRRLVQLERTTDGARTWRVVDSWPM